MNKTVRALLIFLAIDAVAAGVYFGIKALGSGRAADPTAGTEAPKVNPPADIAVIHGGQGTVQTACAAGTPFVGIGLQPEQESNIDAIVRQGSAIRIRKRRLSRKTLLDAIEHLLNNPSARQKTKEIQLLFADWNGTKNSAVFLKHKFG